MGKIRTVVATAKIDGGSIAVFAGLTLMLGWYDIPSIIIGLGMATIAFIELRGASRLAALDASALGTLALNQLVFALLLFSYGGFQFWKSLYGESAYVQAIESTPELKDMLGDVETIVRTILCVAYGALMVVAVACQGGLAMYYLSRRKVVREYLAATPPWVVAVQRAVLAR